MLPSVVLDKFIERCPAAVMVRDTAVEMSEVIAARWAMTPPPDGWGCPKPIIATRNELAKCVGVALANQAVDVKTLKTMHAAGRVWMFRVSCVKWQAYFTRRHGIRQGEFATNQNPKGRSSGNEWERRDDLAKVVRY